MSRPKSHFSQLVNSPPTGIAGAWLSPDPISWTVVTKGHMANPWQPLGKYWRETWELLFSLFLQTFYVSCVLIWATRGPFPLFKTLLAQCQAVTVCQGPPIAQQWVTKARCVPPAHEAKEALTLFSETVMWVYFIRTCTENTQTNNK